MKFWLSLILGSALISAITTYLTMNKGAQFYVPEELPPAQKASPPSVSFEPDPNCKAKLNIVSNVIELKTDTKSKVGVLNTAGFVLKNEGDGPLLLELDNLSCGCTEAFVDNKQITNISPKATIPPKSKAVLELRWKAEKKHLDNQNNSGQSAFHFKGKFLHNDDRYLDPFIVDITTSVIP